jgi:hypothetical protein
MTTRSLAFAASATIAGRGTRRAGNYDIDHRHPSAGKRITESERSRGAAAPRRRAKLAATNSPISTVPMAGLTISCRPTWRLPARTDRASDHHLIGVDRGRPADIDDEQRCRGD